MTPNWPSPPLNPPPSRPPHTTQHHIPLLHSTTSFPPQHIFTPPTTLSNHTNPLHPSPPIKSHTASPPPKHTPHRGPSPSTTPLPTPLYPLQNIELKTTSICLQPSGTRDIVTDNGGTTCRDGHPATIREDHSLPTTTPPTTLARDYGGALEAQTAERPRHAGPTYNKQQHTPSPPPTIPPPGAERMVPTHL